MAVLKTITLTLTLTLQFGLLSGGKGAQGVYYQVDVSRARGWDQTAGIIMSAGSTDTNSPHSEHSNRPSPNSHSNFYFERRSPDPHPSPNWHSSTNPIPEATTDPSACGCTHTLTLPPVGALHPPRGLCQLACLGPVAVTRQ